MDLIKLQILILLFRDRHLLVVHHRMMINGLRIPRLHHLNRSNQKKKLIIGWTLCATHLQKLKKKLPQRIKIWRMLKLEWKR